MKTKMTIEAFLKNLIQEYVESKNGAKPFNLTLLWDAIMSLSFGVRETPLFVGTRKIFTHVKIKEVSVHYVNVNYYDALYVVHYEYLVRFWLKSKNDLYREKLLDDDRLCEDIIIESMATIVLDDLEGIVLSYIESLTPYVCPQLKENISKFFP